MMISAPWIEPVAGHPMPAEHERFLAACSRSGLSLEDLDEDYVFFRNRAWFCAAAPFVSYGLICWPDGLSFPFFAIAAFQIVMAFDLAYRAFQFRFEIMGPRAFRLFVFRPSQWLPPPRRV